MSWWVNQPYAQSVEYPTLEIAERVSAQLANSTITSEPNSITAEEFLYTTELLGDRPQISREDDPRAIELAGTQGRSAP